MVVWWIFYIHKEDGFNNTYFDEFIKSVLLNPYIRVKIRNVEDFEEVRELVDQQIINR